MDLEWDNGVEEPIQPKESGATVTMFWRSYRPPLAASRLRPGTVLSTDMVGGGRTTLASAQRMLSTL
jgi:hypothetical protein